MRVLSSSSEINRELVRLIRSCSSCQVAVAWASTQFEAFDLLAEGASKIERMVVGTHFCQTHPEFIERFLNSPAVRFVLNPDGVFHPKLYLFEITGRAWEAIIGSPNFTRGGLGGNDEFAVLVSGEDIGGPQALAEIKQAIDGYWRKARPLTAADLDVYRRAWGQRQRVRDELASRLAVTVDADALIAFAASLGDSAIPTIGSRSGRTRTLFTAAVRDGTIDFTPQSSKKKYPISRDKLADFCDMYEKNHRSKVTTKYLASGVSSYVLALIDSYEKR